MWFESFEGSWNPLPHTVQRCAFFVKGQLNKFRWNFLHFSHTNELFFVELGVCLRSICLLTWLFRWEWYPHASQECSSFSGFMKNLEANSKFRDRPPWIQNIKKQYFNEYYQYDLKIESGWMYFHLIYCFFFLQIVVSECIFKKISYTQCVNLWIPKVSNFGIF